MLADTAVGFLTTIVNYFRTGEGLHLPPRQPGAVALLVYLVIAVAPVAHAQQLQASGQPIEFRSGYIPG